MPMLICIFEKEILENELKMNKNDSLWGRKQQSTVTEMSLL